MAVQSTLAYFATALIVWLTSVIVYRRFFHPLAKIPGPFLAAITHFYIVKFNLFSEKSQFYLQVENLHQQYGPVVRISPEEIHLSDPDNYEKIYYIGSKAPSKAAYFYDAFGLKTAAFTTPSNELHRVRRAVANPVFSRKAVLQLEGVVQTKIKKLVQRIDEALLEAKPVDIHHGYRAFAVDVITDYAFDNCYNQLDSPSFAAEFFDMNYALIKRAWILQAFPPLLPLSNMVTLGMAKRMNTALYLFLQFRTTCLNQIAEVKQSIERGRDKSQHKTIFHQLLDPNAAEGHVVPNLEDLTDEMFTILTAAADTSGHAMTTTTYYILSNPDIYSALVAELKATFPERTTNLEYLTLEKLPYLTGVIKEGLRFTYGVPGRLPRMIETPEATFNGYTVPRGTIVGMSSWLMHRDPSIWPEPDKFMPERWLDLVKAKKLDKYLVAFTKGSRQCIGMHLAYLELYVGIGTVFRNFENLRMFETTPADLEFDDYFAPFPVKEAKLVKVVGAT